MHYIATHCSWRLVILQRLCIDYVDFMRVLTYFLKICLNCSKRVVGLIKVIEVVMS